MDRTSGPLRNEGLPTSTGLDKEFVRVLIEDVTASSSSGTYQACILSLAKWW